ncbi:hypothetical protein [Capnocytophaga canis]|uniref:hypothetical protein n=1 Tax=Capnocytophaga canis TaxID=1848903 RepID=UPI0005A7ABB1|nr:hypothetical protein [Capnocytophaga canis]
MGKIKKRDGSKKAQRLISDTKNKLRWTVMVWRGWHTAQRLSKSTHTTYFGSYCLQSEAKSEDGDTSCLLMKKSSKMRDFA